MVTINKSWLTAVAKAKEEARRREKFKAQLERLGINPREAAERLGILASTVYAWHCAQRPVPPKRLAQLEEMK